MTKETNKQDNNSKKINWSAIETNARQIIGQALLGGAAIGYIAGNINAVDGVAQYAVAGLIVSLVLFFAHKK